MSLIYTYSEDNTQLTLSDTDYEGFTAGIDSVFIDGILQDTESKEIALKAFDSGIALNNLQNSMVTKVICDNVWMNGIHARTDHNITSAVGAQIVARLEDQFSNDHDWCAHDINLVSEFEPNRPPYANPSISWYNFETTSDALRAEYGLTYSSNHYKPWYGIKFDKVTAEQTLKVVLEKEALDITYYTDGTLPEPVGAGSFVARLHNIDGTVSEYCDYYIITSARHIKEWCDASGHTFPYDYDNTILRDKVWIWGIVFHYDTGVVSHVKAYERNRTE